MRLSNIASLAVLSTFGISTEIRLQRLAELDLTNIKRKLMEPVPEGRGWTQNQADEAEKWYKRYLAVMIKYPEATRHVPNRPIDDFWHQHILDTRAYARDCQHVMGEFLHHYPYFGLNGDAQQRDDSFDETNDLYIEMFGEACTVMVNSMKSQCGGTACQGGGTCNACTVDGDRAPQPVQASNCEGGQSSSGNGGGGSGDTDPCPPARRSMVGASNCNSGGSGTGCGQGCSRGS